jgi:hypothetical protein
MTLAAQAYVLETGTVAFSGTGHELLGDPRVRATYLGGQNIEIANLQPPFIFFSFQIRYKLINPATASLL